MVFITYGLAIAWHQCEPILLTCNRSMVCDLEHTLCSGAGCMLGSSGCILEFWINQRNVVPQKLLPVALTCYALYTACELHTASMFSCPQLNLLYLTRLVHALSFMAQLAWRSSSLFCFKPKSPLKCLVVQCQVLIHSGIEG
jgi:hypothetical protein